MSQKKIDYYDLTFDEEKEVAVKMWQYIKWYITRHPDKPIHFIKEKFIKKTFLMKDDNYQRFVWYNDCILCTYVDTCSHCPLNKIDKHTCNDSKSAYSRADDKYLNIKDRLAACDTIIRAIRLLEEEE